MKRLINPSIDKLNGSLEFDAANEVQEIRLYGLNRNGTLTITWSGLAGNLAVDILACERDSESTGVFTSVLSAPITDSDTVHIIDLCAGWLQIDATGTVWGLGPDTLFIDYNLKAVEPMI